MPDLIITVLSEIHLCTICIVPIRVTIWKSVVDSSMVHPSLEGSHELWLDMLG